MRNAFQFVAFFSIVLFSGPTAFADDEKPVRHDWETIAFPRLPQAADGSLSPRIYIRNENDRGFELVLSYSFLWEEDTESKKKLPASESLRARLYTGDGQVSEMKQGLFSGMGGFSKGKAVYYTYYLGAAWSRNALDEAWIELRLAGQTYWIELPYGFTRNPTDPLAPVDKQRGKPSYPPKMKIGEKDRSLPWQYVTYDFWTIQNGWKLKVQVSNPVDAAADVVLSRDNSMVGRDTHRWELSSPRTNATITETADSSLRSTAKEIRLQEDGVRRSDTFKFERYVVNNNVRGWGKLLIQVDDKKYACVVPSSLYRHLHGLADPHSKALVPRSNDR